MVTLWNTLLQTVSQMPSVTLAVVECNKWADETADGCQLARVPACHRALQKEANLKWKDKDGTGKKKGQGDRTVQKMFAESILNTVVEVTIYLMPAKLARTSGAGYLVQLFMISSKI